MNANRILRFLINICGGLMLLAAASGSAQAMAPAKTLPAVAVQDAAVAALDGNGETAAVQKVYWRYYYRPRFRYYRPYYYRPRYYYRPHYYYRRHFYY